jgi:hypothetical protein
MTILMKILLLEVPQGMRLPSLKNLTKDKTKEDLL